MRFLIFVAAACLALTAVIAAEEKKIVCYFGSWAVYRPGAGKFVVEDIDPTLCTHLIYTFVGLAGDKIRLLDAWQDVPDNWGLNGFGRFNALREKSPSTKTLVAIGGWNQGSTKYSEMAKRATNRTNFVKNAVAFVKRYNFSGFDLDWEYPAQLGGSPKGERGGSPVDVKNFVLLLKEMREAFDKEGLLLTAAVGAAKSSASQSYDIPEISKYLHFINLMTYDLHGSWESKTGINAALYHASSETDSEQQLTVAACIKYWLDQGAPAEKLIVGIPTYGRSFTLANPSNADIGHASRGSGPRGPYTRESGFLGYNEICELQNTEQWNVKFDEERRSPFAYRGNQWVGYDNVKSVKEKAEYVKKLGLGGAMVWSIDTDDFKGKCGETYPLIRTLNHVLRNGKEVVERPPQPPAVTETPEQPPATQKPTTPNGDNNNGSGKCTAPGNIADPTTCTRFIQCIHLFGDTYKQVIVPCSPSLCYNPILERCDWPRNQPISQI